MKYCFLSYQYLYFPRWTKTSKLIGGMWSGPIVLFDTSDNVIIISPFNHFMAASYYSDHQTKSLSWGIMGEVNDIPPDFLFETIVYYSNKGINKVIGC